jgi:hypothetical protein
MKNTFFGYEMLKPDLNEEGCLANTCSGRHCPDLTRLE